MWPEASDLGVRRLTITDFEDPRPDLVVANDTGEEPLVVDLGAYEGPLDVLLALARQQKVDLAKISILKLADQFLTFIAEARKIRLEIAADYLVMAAWLAYLKSRLLLPPEENLAGELTAPEMAARLRFQLQRLEAMRLASERLFGRHRLGRDVFGRGCPEGVRVIRNSVFELSLYDLLKGYADFKTQNVKIVPLRMRSHVIHTIEQALKRMGEMLGSVPAWTRLERFLPEAIDSPEERRSAVAAALSASLELCRRGQISIRQGETFGPIYIQPRPASEPAPAVS